VTVLTDLKAIGLTASAKGVISAKGPELSALVTMAQLHVTELQTVLKQILALHPSGGGDASNYAALNAVLAQLAYRCGAQRGVPPEGCRSLAPRRGRYDFGFEEEVCAGID
jgi:hypothetical protein